MNTSKAMTKSAVLLLLFCFSFAAQAQVLHHYEYVFTSGFIYVYDIDNSGALVKTLSVPTTAGVRGAVANAVTGMVYIAYGTDSGSGGSQLALNLTTDQVVWTNSYNHGIDSQAVSPDGTRIYMPSGELSSDSNWYVEDSSNGNDIATIVAGNSGSGTGTGPHNTIVNLAGTRVYMGMRDYNLGSGSGSNDFAVASTSNNQVIGRITPTKSGVRPFTINSTETLAYISVTGFIGFQVGSLTTGNVLYTVAVDGSNIPGYTTQSSVTDPSHGIALSSDDKTLYLIDQPNSYVHVFDVSGGPNSAPVQIADIQLPDIISGTQTECAYDCEKDGWLHISHDGKYLFVGDTPDVISTSSRTLAMRMPMMANSRIEIEIDFSGDVPIWAMGSRSSFGGIPTSDPLTITSTAMPGGTVGVAYSQNIGIAGGQPPYTCLSTSSDGLTINSNCTITGTPVGAQTVFLAASVTDAALAQVAGTLTVVISPVVVPAPLALASLTLPSGIENTPYSQAVTPTGGTPPYKCFSSSSDGLSVGANCVITGTPPAALTATLYVNVNDSATPPGFVSVPQTIVINPASGTMYPFYPYFDSSGMTFSYTQGGAIPSDQSTWAHDSSPCPPPAGVPTCHWFTTLTTDQAWLSVTPTTGTTAFSITVSVAPSGLASGTYQGNIISTIAQETGSPRKLPITLIVTGATVNPLVMGCSFVSGTFVCNVTNVAHGQQVSVSATSNGQTVTQTGTAP
jgi:hypothetical protein